MSQSVREYVEFLANRGDLWPKVKAVEPPRATPAIKPLPGIEAVTWNVYGTLIRVADGELLHDHPQSIRMQVALERTIEEFNMWNSMYRTPEAPWEYMYQRWRNALDDARLTGTGRKGDLPPNDSSALWRVLIAQLEKKEYTFDASTFDDFDDLAVKVAYFFHAKLQGFEAAEHALRALEAVGRSDVKQGLLADTQPFTMAQLTCLLSSQGTVPPLGELFDPALLVQSHAVGCRKPSPTLLDAAVERLESLGIEPHRTLHVGNDFANDLAPAKQRGFRTALYAGDKLSLRASSAELKDRETRPDRLLTDLAQVREILEIP